MGWFNWVWRTLFPREGKPVTLRQAFGPASGRVLPTFRDGSWSYGPVPPDPDEPVELVQACKMAANHVLPLFNKDGIAVIFDIAAHPDVRTELERLGCCHVLPLLHDFDEYHTVRGEEKAQLFRVLTATLRLATPREFYLLVVSARYLDQNGTCLSNDRLPRFDAYPPVVALPMAGIISLLARDGHVREAAVREMIRHPLSSSQSDPDGRAAMAFPYIIIRLCDWVPQVRAAALEALEYLVSRLDISVFFDADPFLFFLERSRRAPPQAAQHVADRILSLFKDPGITDEPCFRQEKGGRFIWKIVSARADEIPNTAWRFLAECGPSPARMAAARRRTIDWKDDLWRRRASVFHEPDPRVRRAWLWRCMEEKGECSTATAVFQEALFDPSSLVRETAVYALRRLGIKPAGLYRDAIRPILIADPTSVPGSWALGLAAVGTEQDADWFRLWQTAEVAELRAAGLIGMGRIRPEETDQAALTLIWDERRAPRVAAARWLIKRNHPEHISELRRCFEKGGPGARRTAYRVLLQRGMERVVDIFAALPDERLRAISWDAFVGWARRYGWHAATGSAPLAWRSLSSGSREIIQESWNYLVKNYAYDPPQLSRWQTRILDEYPAPYIPPEEPKASLGMVPFEAWKNWSSFPQLLEELNR